MLKNFLSLNERNNNNSKLEIFIRNNNMDLFSKTIKNISFKKIYFFRKFKFTMWFQNTALKK